MKIQLILPSILVLLFCITNKSHSQNAQKNTIGISIAAPWINSYAYYDYDLAKPKTKSGFTGLGASVYERRNGNMLSLNLGITGSSPAPVGAPEYAHEGTQAGVGAAYVELVNQRKAYKKFDISAGINFVSYLYNFTSYIDSLPGYRKFDKTLGITIGPVYNFSREFAAGLHYRPALYSFSHKQYRHLISLSVRANIDFK